jgi:hypothetical protein
VASIFSALTRQKRLAERLGFILTRRLNSQLRHAGLDPASSVLLDSRLRGNDELRVFIRRSNIKRILSIQGTEIKLQKVPKKDNFKYPLNFSKSILIFVHRLLDIYSA